MKQLTHRRLLEVLRYNRRTGVFRWRIQLGVKAPAGAVAGTLDSLGYVCIMIDQRQYKAHRLAWFYVHGVRPTHGIDHRNRRVADNRIKNLRCVTQSVNMHNRQGKQRNNTSGYLGVGRDKARNKWAASLTIDGVEVYRGRFATPEEAHLMYSFARLFYL